METVASRKGLFSKNQRSIPTCYEERKESFVLTGCMIAKSFIEISAFGFRSEVQIALNQTKKVESKMKWLRTWAVGFKRA